MTLSPQLRVGWSENIIRHLSRCQPFIPKNSNAEILYSNHINIQSYYLEQLSHQLFQCLLRYMQFGIP